MSQVYHPAGSKFKVVPASIWSKLKTVTKGENPNGAADIWEENDNIRGLRALNGIFVNDHFMQLWDVVEGLTFLDGGYGSSKTTYVITRLLVKAMENKYFRCYYGRQKKTEARNLHMNIITEIKRNGWEDLFSYSEKPNGSPRIVHKASGNFFEMFGCDDVQSLKGWDNPTDILIDECNQISFEVFGMMQSRLRTPGQRLQFYGCFNNCDVYPDHWLYKFIYNDEEPKNDQERLLKEALKDAKITKHHSNYLHNLFQNPVAYKAKLITQAGGDLEKVEAYLEGKWGVKLNSQPYYKQFSVKHHVGDCVIDGIRDYNPNLPLHFIFDENVNPYMPCLIIQASGQNIYVIDEIAFTTPNNSLKAVCDEVVGRYYNHKAGLYIYGDATSKKSDVKLEEGENFFTLAMGYLKRFNPELRVSDKNPSNKMRKDYVNAIFGLGFNNLAILISPTCKHMIEDLQNCQESPDGKGKDKKREMVNGVRGVQRYGHFGDCLDYFLCECYRVDYALFQSDGIMYAPTGGGRVTRNSTDIDVDKEYKKLLKEALGEYYSEDDDDDDDDDNYPIWYRNSNNRMT